MTPALYASIVARNGAIAPTGRKAHATDCEPYPEAVRINAT
jgi:hypothetical protein